METSVAQSSILILFKQDCTLSAALSMQNSNPQKHLSRYKIAFWSIVSLRELALVRSTSCKVTNISHHTIHVKLYSEWNWSSEHFTFIKSHEVMLFWFGSKTALYAAFATAVAANIPTGSPGPGVTKLDTSVESNRTIELLHEVLMVPS